MAPKKKEPEEVVTAAENATTNQDDGRLAAISKFRRDENGLLTNISYVFKEDGSIDWKQMIPSKYIVVNTEYFEKRQIQPPASTEGLEDKQVLVLLGGIKELAKIRGVLCVERKVLESSNDRAVVSCKITFAPNYETDMKPFVFEEVASATLNNTNSFSQLFLETIASNRALVRAIRNALRIDIVGSDELLNLPTNNNAESTGQGLAWQALKDAAQTSSTESFKDGFKTFEEFIGFLKAKNVAVVNENGVEWQDWPDIPATTAFKLISSLKKATAKAKAA